MNKDIRGQRFYQELLPKDLQRVIAGQTTIIKIILVIISIIISIISASIAGLLGSVICLEVIASSDPQSRFSYFCMTLVIVAWLVATLKKGIIKGLFVAGISILLTILIAAAITITLSLNDNLIDKVFLITAIFTLLAILSLFINQFSLYLIHVLFSNNLQFINKIFIAFFVATTTILSYKFLFSAYNSQYIDKFYQARLLIIEVPFYQIKYFAVFCGAIASCSIAIANLKIKKFAKNGKTPDFIKMWAIAVGSWGGTSFYNLDLSNIDFTNSQLANSDLRASKFYRTCLKKVQGLDKARLDNRYLDLMNHKVQNLLITGVSEDTNFSGINLQGAYLRNANLRHFQLIETNLKGADLKGADLRGSILVRTQVTGVDFTGAQLTGICIEDWNVNSKTCFANVKCDYIYRKLDEKGEPIEQYPLGRNFETGEFEALFQEVEEVVELVFKEGVNWRALSFTFRKFQLEDDGLGLELKGVEQRGDLWVVKVTHKEGVLRQDVEQRVGEIYEMMKGLVAVKEPQINKLLDIAADQAGALKESSKRPFGNSFFITGSTITNLAGSGEINYDEAANKIRSFVAHSSEPVQSLHQVNSLLEQFQRQSIATSSDEQTELIKQVILAEARKDPFFKQFFLQQGQQIANVIPESAIASAIREALSQLI